MAGIARIRRFARTLPALAIAGAVAACAVDPPPQGEGGTPEAVARSTAAELGLTPDRVTVRRDVVEAADGRERLQGYIVWVEVAECDEGQVIVRLNRILYVQTVTGVYGCTVPAA